MVLACVDEGYLSSLFRDDVWEEACGGSTTGSRSSTEVLRETETVMAAQLNSSDHDEPPETG